MGSSVTKAKCALERFFIYCPAPPFMNVAIPKKCSEEIYFLAEMVSMGSIVTKAILYLLPCAAFYGCAYTKAKCTSERFFIYCPAPQFMNVAIPEKCSEEIYLYISWLKWFQWAAS
jgi:hypothetical protein